MPDMPRVTIVTPTYNQAEYLSETIESVLSQTYKNIEFIVVNDGSTDHTPKILESYHGRITCFNHPNMGQARTLNRGWQIAKGKYIGYLSSDDLLREDAVAKLVALLEAAPNVVCAFPDADLIDHHSRIIKKNVCRPFDLEKLVVRQECYIGPSALFRREAYLACGGWNADLRLAPDREFWMRLANFGEIKFLQASLSMYRFHPNSISYREFSEETSLEYVKVLDDYFSSPTIPKELLNRKDEAYGFAYYIVARNCFRGGCFRRGHFYYEKACRFHPQLRSPGYMLQIAKNVLSKPLRTMLSRVKPW